MKKATIVLLAALSLPMLGYANCGNGGDNGNGCSGDGGGVGPQGPQGPAGPQGNPGNSGTNGSNGTNGANGKNGAPGPSAIDPRMNEAKLGLDTAIRLYDGKRVQLQVYNIWTPSLHNNEDAVGDGRNLMFGVRFVFKLGKSYEEELLEKQASQIKALEAIVSRMQ